MVKPGYLTTEFWLHLIAQFLVAFGAVNVPHNTKGFAMAALFAAYSVSRGLAKSGSPDDVNPLADPEFSPTGPPPAPDTNDTHGDD